MPAQEPEPRPRAPQSRTAEALDLLRRNRDFRLMFVAQLISLGGDWFLSVALFGLVFEFTGSPALVSALIATMSVPYALMTFVGGPAQVRAQATEASVTTSSKPNILPSAAGASPERQPDRRQRAAGGGGLSVQGIGRL